MSNYKVNVGISYDHPQKGHLVHQPGEVADLTGWPDLDKLIAEGTIEAEPTTVVGFGEQSTRVQKRTADIRADKENG